MFFTFAVYFLAAAAGLSIVGFLLLCLWDVLSERRSRARFHR